MKTVKKSLAVLDLFLAANGELSLDEVAGLSGINKSTTRRIVMALMEFDLLSQSKKRGKYSLGMKFLDFGQVIRRNLPLMEITDSFLTQLGSRIDETVALAIWNGKRAIISQSIHPNHPLKVTVFIGVMSQLHQTSLGKAILAELSEDKIESIIGADLQRFTPNTITDINDLKKNLTVIQRNGVAIDDEEGYIGVRGMAAAFKYEDGSVGGAITVIGPSVRLTREKVKEYSPIVKDCASSISKALGYKG
jgi:IclR family KDG regulon transcriptional repressor